MVSIFWARSPYFSKHVSFWWLFVDSHLDTYHKNRCLDIAIFDLGTSTLQARACMYEEQYNLIEFSSKTCGQSVIIVKYLSCCNFWILLHNLGWKWAKYTDKEKIRLGKKAPVSLPAKWNHMTIYKYKWNQDNMAYIRKDCMYLNPTHSTNSASTCLPQPANRLTR